MIQFRIICRFLIILLFVDVTFGCMGFQVYTKNVTNLSHNNLVKVYGNATADFTSECSININGCILTEGFSTANIHVEFYRDDIRIRALDFNWCDQPDNVELSVRQILQGLGLRTKCPVEKIDKCTEQASVYDINDRKYLLKYFKNRSLRLDITMRHGNEGTSKIRIVSEIFENNEDHN